MLGDVEALGEKGLLEAHGLSVAWGVWGAVSRVGAHGSGISKRYVTSRDLVLSLARS